MKRYEKYIERNDLRNASHLEVSVYYTKGGGAVSRGYYLSVRPVTKSEGMVSFDLFAGRRQFLFGTSRVTEKQLHKAIEMAKGMENELISAVAAENQAA